MVTKFRRVQKTVGTTAPEEGVSEVRVTSMGRVNAFVEEAIERLVGSEKHVATKQIKVMARGGSLLVYSEALCFQELLLLRQ